MKKIAEKIILAGAGGQGVLSLGRMLAEAAACENKNTTWIPSYGAEMRGGTAHCFVRVSEDEISSPIFSDPTILIILNQPSFDRFFPKLAVGGLAIVNSDTVDVPKDTGNKKIILVPMNSIAVEAGSIKAANIAAFGTFLKVCPILKKETVRKMVEEKFSSKPKLVEINLKALEAGYEQNKN